jgi:hypothetical protein
MSGFGFLLWLASIIAVFSLPLLYFAVLMRLVGRISSRSLSVILVVAAALWATAAFYWSLVRTRI